MQRAGTYRASPEAVGCPENGLDRPARIRLAHACAAAGVAVIVFLSFWLEPDPRGLGTHEQLFLLPCNFHTMTGLPCPFCGITTAFAHMARGEVAAAFMAQPMGALGFAFCAVMLPLLAGAAISGKNLIGALMRLPWNKLAWVVGAMFLLSWFFKIAVTLHG